MLVPALTFPVRGATALVATMPVPASPSGGQKMAPGCNAVLGSRRAAPSAVSAPAGCPATSDLGQQVAQRRHLTVNQPVVASEEVGVVVAGGRIDREHPRGVTDPEHPQTREFLVHVTGKGGDMLNLRHMRLGVSHGLVQVRNRPPQRDVDAEQPREAR